MFKSGELDYVGAPLIGLPPDALQSLKSEGKLMTKPKANTYYLMFNTEAAPFTNDKIRKAFAYAVDSKALTDNITQAGEQPTTSFLPTSMAVKPESYY